MTTHDEHSSFIQTPQQLIVVIVAAFLVPIIGIILIVQLVTSAPGADPAALTPDAVAARLKPVAHFELGGAGGGSAGGPQAVPAQQASAAAKAGPADGKKVFDGTCTACHSTGVANAPKLGDKNAWAPRIKEGVDTLVQHALQGKGAMPPKGGNASLSEAEIRAAVQFMVSQAK